MAGDEAGIRRIYGSVLGVMKSKSKAVATVRTAVASIDTRIEVGTYDHGIYSWFATHSLRIDAICEIAD